MASTAHRQSNGIRARFQLHSQSSDRDLRAALELAKQQQDWVLRGRRIRRRNEDAQEKTYTVATHDVSGVRPRKRPSPVPTPRQNFQDDSISRLERRYSFSSEDRKQEALLGPSRKIDPVLSSSNDTTDKAGVIIPPAQQHSRVAKAEAGPNVPSAISSKEQRKADKRSQKELEAKVKHARKMVKADIKDKAKKSRKKLKATYKAASSNPESFVAWAEAYERLAAIPADGAAPALQSANAPHPQTSIQWLKGFLPKFLAGKSKPPAYTAWPAMSYPTMPISTIFELPANDLMPELDASESVSGSFSRQPAKLAGPSSKGKSKALDISSGEPSGITPWKMPAPVARLNYNFQDLSLLDSSLPESRSGVKTVTTPLSTGSVSEYVNSDTTAQSLLREKSFLRDEIGRLGAQAAAKLRQCATEMEQAEGLRNIKLKRALSEQHRRHAQELEKFTAALKTLEDHGGRTLPKSPEGASKEDERSREHKMARREEDLTLQLREASLREREVVLREREAASRECEAASRERQAASLVTVAFSKERQAKLQKRLWLLENEPMPTRGEGTLSKTLNYESDHKLPGEALPPRSSRSGTKGELEHSSNGTSDSSSSQQTRLAPRAAGDILEPLEENREVSAQPSSDHQERRPLHHVPKKIVDQFIAGLLPLRSVGFRTHAVPKRKSAGSATFAAASSQSRTSLAPSNRRRVNKGKGKGKEVSEDEEDSDAEPRKRRRRNPPIPHPDQRLLACPYSKYDICRYSEMNATEKCYRGCTSCYLIDISRLKQHLYRVHRRPENYCPRCFEVFETGVLLDEHARQLISCKVAKCPFPERLTDAQVKELKKKWNGKSTEQCWYIIFKIVFPRAPRPHSPYADDKTSVVVQLEAQTAPQRLSRLFRERLSQLEHTPVTAPLWLAEVQTVLSQVVEDSMAKLLRQTTPSHAPGSGSDSAAEVDPISSLVHKLQSDQACYLQTTSIIEGSQDEISCATSPNESLPSLLDLDFGITEFDKNAFEDFVALGNGQVDDSRSSPGPSNWSELSHVQSATGDMSPLSQWDEEQAEPPSIANFYSDAAFGGTQDVQTTSDGRNSTGMHRIPGSSPSSELSFPESSSNCTLPQASPAMGPPPPVVTLRSQGAATGIAQPLQTKRSQHSLDSGYGSILTAQQSHTSNSSCSSTENLSNRNTGFYDTLAESWGPVTADEEAFCQQARGSSSKTSYFSESRTVDYPSVTY